MVSPLSLQAVPNTPLYISSIVNIKHKARNWNIAGHTFDLEYTKINSQIRVHGDYGAYNELEKMWHVEFYIWSHYFLNEPFPFPFPTTTKPTLISVDNPAPAPLGPRPMNSIPVPNPFPPVYTPGPRTAPTKPAARASLPPQFKFNIRGTASYNQAQSSPTDRSQDARVGRAYNNRRTRGGRRSLESRIGPVSSTHGGKQESLQSRMGPVGLAGSGRHVGQDASAAKINRPWVERPVEPRIGHNNGAGFVESGVGVVKQNGRTAVQAARRQLKIVRRTGGRT